MPSLPVLIGIFVGMVLVMNAAWAYQRAAGDSGWIDVFWTFGTGAVGAIAALLPFAGETGPTTRQTLVAAIVVLWSLRLGSYIALRVAGSQHEDARYRHFRDVWSGHYQRTLYLFVMPQAAVTALLCVSIQTAAQRPVNGLDWRDIAGAAILLIAIVGEGLADRQLARFKATHKAKGAICDVGLWRWSRHPNYFFEWFGWLAYPVIALDFTSPITLLTVLAPAAMYVVLRYLTGAKPLEITMLASRGDAYRAYQSRTSAFIPLPPKGATP